MIYLCSCNTVLHVTWYILWRLCHFIKSSQAQKQCFQTYQSWPPFSKYPFPNVCPLVAGVGIFVCSVHHFILLLPPNWLWLSQRCVTKEVSILVWKVCFIKALLSGYPFLVYWRINVEMNVQYFIFQTTEALKCENRNFCYRHTLYKWQYWLSPVNSIKLHCIFFKRSEFLWEVF